MNTIKKDYIKKAIDNWDPIDLLPFAPSDEYDIETDRIYDTINGKKEINNIFLGKVIYDVFRDMFGDKIFLKTLEECKEIARDIIQLSL